MKAIKLIIGCLLLFGFSVQAQNFYLRTGLGIAVTTAADYAHEYDQSDGSNCVKSKKSGLGTGIPITAAAGYSVSDNFSFEMAVNYFRSFARKTKSNYYEYTSDCKKKGNMLSLIPAVVLGGIHIDKFSPYARLGLIVGIINSVTRTYKYEYASTMRDFAMKTEYKYKDYGGVSIGVQAAAGGKFTFTDMFSMFAEIQVNGVSFAPKHGKITEYKEDGVDKLDDMKTKQKEWDYIKDFDQNESIPDDDPDKKKKVNHPFGNVGLVIGVAINFNK